MLKILSRITAPTSGQVKVKGRIASLLEVGTGFHPELTGRDNIYLNGAILGMKTAEIDRKFDEIVDFSGIDQFIDTPVKRYSSGMYVRLAFAVAAHLDPEILLVDEVLAVGDAEFQKKCLGKMGDVAKEGRTVLFVSHNMGAINNLCHMAHLIERGHIKYSGNVEDVVSEYLKTMKQRALSTIDTREDRHGNGNAQIVDIKTKDNKSGNTIESLWSGEAIDIYLTIMPKKPVLAPIFLLTFYDSYGQKIFHCNSEVAGFKNRALSKIDKPTTVICSIPKLPLPAGEYSLNVALLGQNDLVDHVESALSVPVMDGNFFATGRSLMRKDGVVLVEHEWHLCEGI